MNHVKLLDCTLRDGAYLLDKKFGENNIKGIIDGLVKSNMDFIEIGFFHDEGYGEGCTSYRNSQEAKKYIPKDKKGCKFTVLTDYSKYSIDKLDQRDPDSIDAVRECFQKDERYEVMEVCKKIKEKGYTLFMQPGGILSYTDEELLELIRMVNEVKPYSFAIVDTFGSMYQEDLHRVFELINHNLDPDCRISFHSHNNMQMSNALSQEFVRMSFGKREVIIDGTLSGMGRGAGNTPTELIAEYLNSRWNYNYNIDAMLDVIDDYMDNIRTKCHWGYSTEYFVAGSYASHPDNIKYLTQKNSIRYTDIRYILNEMGPDNRRKRNHEMLEDIYMKRISSDIDDSKTIEYLNNNLYDRDILVVAPGSSVTLENEKILNFVNEKNPVIISVGFVPDYMKEDYVYMSNTRRYSAWKNEESFRNANKILASNIKQTATSDKELIVSFSKLVKSGWENLDNSTILLLRLLDKLDVRSISIAGLDGYDYDSKNYTSDRLESSIIRDVSEELNEQIENMLTDYIETRTKDSKISFLTTSRFEKIIKEKSSNQKNKFIK